MTAQQRGAPLTEREEMAMRQMAKRLAPRHLTWAHRRSAYSGTIDATIDGKPLVGNTTIKHVKEMLRAMGAR